MILLVDDVGIPRESSRLTASCSRFDLRHQACQVLSAGQPRGEDRAGWGRTLIEFGVLLAFVL